LIFLVSRSIATTEGSLSTIPSPFTYTSVFAVPRSTAMALAGKNEPDLKKGQRIYGLTRAFTRDASGSGLATGLATGLALGIDSSYHRKVSAITEPSNRERREGS